MPEGKSERIVGGSRAGTRNSAGDVKLFDPGDLHLNGFVEMVQVGVRVRSNEPATDNNLGVLHTVNGEFDAFIKEKIVEGLGAEDINIGFVTEEHAAVGWAFANAEAINAGFDGLVTCLALFFVKAPQGPNGGGVAMSPGEGTWKELPIFLVKGVNDFGNLAGHFLFASVEIAGLRNGPNLDGSKGSKSSVVFTFEQAGEDLIPFRSAAGTHAAATVDECAKRRGLAFHGKLHRAGDGFWWQSRGFSNLGGCLVQKEPRS